MAHAGERVAWIDWMKTLGIYFIIAGHCFGPGYKIVYAFSVPLFFVISGFLYKIESTVNEFLRKLFWNLIVPMLIYLLLNVLFNSLKHMLTDTFQVTHIYDGIKNGIFGRQGENYASGGLGGMWFVYTLVLCKSLIKILPNKYRSICLIIINLVFLFLLQFYEQYLHTYNSFTNLVLAFPFFSIGYVLKHFKNKIHCLGVKDLFTLIPFAILGLIISTRYNGVVFLYNCSYGGNLFMCFLGALSGAVLIMGISVLLGNLTSKLPRIIGGAR